MGVGMRVMMAVMGRPVGVLVEAMAMIVVVKKLLRDVRKELPGRRSRSAGPLDAPFFPRSLEKIVPGELSRVPGHVEPLRQRREHQLADAPPVPSLAVSGKL